MTQIVGAGKDTDHRLVSLGPQVDALTGEEWEWYECPVCGFLQRIQFDPFRRETLRLGAGMISKEEAAEHDILAKTPAGRAQVEQRISEAPGHYYVGLPSFEDLRRIAEAEGKAEDFERAVNRALVDGVPIWTFGIGGHEVSVWPPGMGPR